MAGFPTYKGSAYAEYILELIRVNAADLGARPEACFYGDRSIIPESPTVCVEPAQTQREIAGSPMVMDNSIRVAIIVYSTHLESNEVAQKNGDLVAENIEDFLNLRCQPVMLYADGDQLNGMVTSGFVESIARGYLLMNDRKARANRMIWVGYTHTHLVLDAQGAKHA
jgi:hypothetical protein